MSLPLPPSRTSSPAPPINTSLPPMGAGLTVSVAAVCSELVGPPGPWSVAVAVTVSGNDWTRSAARVRVRPGRSAAARLQVPLPSAVPADSREPTGSPWMKMARVSEPSGSPEVATMESGTTRPPRAVPLGSPRKVSLPPLPSNRSLPAPPVSVSPPPVPTNVRGTTETPPATASATSKVGVSATACTVRATAAVAKPPRPSATRKEKLSVPLNPPSGV